jgi:hypothetical protein
MPIGPGKYDMLCTIVRESAKADAVIIMVFNGNKGSGFSIQGPLEFSTALPRVLRAMADEIDKNLDGMSSKGEDDERRDART